MDTKTKLGRRNLPWVLIFILPTLVMFLMFYLWPIVEVFYTSFTRYRGFGLHTAEWMGFDNFIRLFNMQSFMISITNIALWSLIAVVLHVSFGVVVAFIFYRGIPGWKFARAAFMVPIVISSAAWAMIYRFVFNNDFGILNNIIRVFIPEFDLNWFFSSPAAFWAITFTWVFYAVIVTMVVLGDLMAIPADLLEAASIDGASSWQKTWLIKLPLCRFSIGTGVIMSITSRISMYEAIALTSRGGPGDDTMSLSLILVRAISDNNFGLANATAVIMFIMGIATMILINKLFRMNDSVY